MGYRGTQRYVRKKYQIYRYYLDKKWGHGPPCLSPPPFWEGPDGAKIKIK